MGIEKSRFPSTKESNNFREIFPLTVGDQIKCKSYKRKAPKFKIRIRDKHHCIEILAKITSEIFGLFI